VAVVAVAHPATRFPLGLRARYARAALLFARAERPWVREVVVGVAGGEVAQSAHYCNLVRAVTIRSPGVPPPNRTFRSASTVRLRHDPGLDLPPSTAHLSRVVGGFPPGSFSPIDPHGSGMCIIGPQI
jgi:hypothetical protein